MKNGEIQKTQHFDEFKARFGMENIAKTSRAWSTPEPKRVGGYFMIFMTIFIIWARFRDVLVFRIGHTNVVYFGTNGPVFWQHDISQLYYTKIHHFLTHIRNCSYRLIGKWWHKLCYWYIFWMNLPLCVRCASYPPNYWSLSWLVAAALGPLVVRICYYI